MKQTVYVSKSDEQVWKDAQQLAKQEGVSLSSLATGVVSNFVFNRFCELYPNRIDEIYQKGVLNFKA